MQGHLSLIKTGAQDLEKRVFPRFPFSYLLFKVEDGEKHAFEVKDISYSGMQLCLKDGGHHFKSGETIKGSLQWKGNLLQVEGPVQWVKGQRLGVAFALSSDFDTKIKDFLSVKNIVASMKALHDADMELEVPGDLKYWLQADGPVEVFIWQHSGGNIAKFQIIMMDSFIEYQDGKGLRSGRILTKRDVDTPLVHEDEFVFEIDGHLSQDRMLFAKELVCHVPPAFLSEHAMEFLKIKLGINQDN